MRCGRVGEERGVSFVQCTEVNKPSNMVEEALHCICVMWSTIEEMQHSVRGKEMESALVRGWNGVKSMSSMMGSGHIVRSSSAVHPIIRELL